MCTGTVSNIIVDAHGEGIGFLEYHSYFLAKCIHFRFKNVISLITNFTRNFYRRDQIVHTIQSFKKSGFPAAGRTDQCRDTFFGNVHGDVFQRLGLSIPQVQIADVNYGLVHAALLLLKYRVISVADKLTKNARIIRIEAMANAGPNSPLSFA